MEFTPPKSSIAYKVEIPPSSRNVASINNWKDMDKKAFENFQNVSDYELDRDRKRHSYTLRKRIEYGLCIFGGLTVLSLLIASFSAVMGWIENKILEELFLTIAGAFVSIIVGFGIGKFYEKSR